MTDSDTPTDYNVSPEQRKKVIMQELNLETSKIPWSELQKFFASGVAIVIDNELDLLDTVAEITMDNKSQVMQWMEQGKVAGVNDEQAVAWLENDTMLWAVVVAPYVFIQEPK